MRKLFSRYGKVLRVSQYKNQKTYILFDDLLNAVFAQKALNEVHLTDADVRLLVNWCNDLDNLEFEFSDMQKFFEFQTVRGTPSFTRNNNGAIHQQSVIHPRPNPIPSIRVLLS